MWLFKQSTGDMRKLMKKFDRDLIQETIDEMGLTITFDSEESGFIDNNGDLLFMDEYMAEMQDVFQFIRGYDEQ